MSQGRREEANKGRGGETNKDKANGRSVEGIDIMGISNVKRHLGEGRGGVKKLKI